LHRNHYKRLIIDADGSSGLSLTANRFPVLEWLKISTFIVRRMPIVNHILNFSRKNRSGRACDSQIRNELSELVEDPPTVVACRWTFGSHVPDDWLRGAASA